MLEINRIYNQDCLEGLKQIEDESIDLCVTDPPYKVISGGNKDRGTNGFPKSVLNRNDGKIFDFNDIDFKDWIPEVYRVLKKDTHFYCMTNVINLKDVIETAEKVGFKLHNILVWEKNTANPNRWYMKNCEFTLFFYKGQAKTINNPGSKQVHQFNNIVGNKCHPTEKPVELMQFYIENSSKEGDLVLDPFMGGGATAVACKNSKRNFIGFEIDEKFYKVIEERLSEKEEEEPLIENLFSFDFGGEDL